MSLISSQYSLSSCGFTNYLLDRVNSWMGEVYFEDSVEQASVIPSALSFVKLDIPNSRMEWRLTPKLNSEGLIKKPLIRTGILLSDFCLIALVFTLTMIIKSDGNNYNLMAFAIYGFPILLFLTSGIFIKHKSTENLLQKF